MARLFDCLEKRKLMYSSRVKREEAVDGAQSYLELGRLNDALDLFGKIEDTEGMDRVLAEGRKKGDVFIVKRALSLLKKEVDAPFWRDLAKEAEDKGKYASAARALLEAGDEEEAAAIRERAMSVAGRNDDLGE